MKQVFLSILLMFMPMVASADGVEVDGIYYNFGRSAKTAEVTYKKYENGDYVSDYSGNVIIPSEVVYRNETYSITSIGNNAFYMCSGLNSVTIPESVTSIGYGAFKLCSGLTTLTIPNSVTSIGQSAFIGCSGLTSVKVSDGLTFIEENVFYGCTNLTSINIPNSVGSIGDYAFYNCKSLKTIAIPKNITRIGENAFKDCWGLTSVQITDLEAWCRINFRNVDSNPLFYAHHIFLNGDEIENLYIPSTVTGIENYAFYNCQGLVSISIPSSVTRISKNAFLGCYGLTSLTIPGNVINIGEGSFAACKNLTTVTIEEGVASIGKSAFYDCTALQSITIPNSVTDIWDYTFMYCSSLTSFTASNNIKSIRDHAFYQCGGLTEITLGSGLETIYPYAFAACSKLADVYCYAEKVPIMTDIDNQPHTNAFDGFDGSSPIENATLHVPAASIEAYKSTEPWSSFNEIVSLEEETPDYPKFIYEIGNESGWMTPHALCKIDDRNAYRGYYYLDGEFKFKPQEDLNDWNGDWEYDGETIGATGKITPNGHTNCPSVEPGFYQILVDLDEMTYIVSRIETIGICGSFTGWSADVDMTYDVKNNVWLADRIVFDQDDNDFKFRANHAWDFNWGGADDNLVFYGPELHLAAGSYDFALSLSYEGNNKVSIIPSSQKCATPTIIYENGKVKFACETFGVSFKYKIEIEDATENEGDEFRLTGIYKVTVYATKAGCKDSDVATKEINISGTGSGDLNGDGVINAADVVTLVNSIMGE